MTSWPRPLLHLILLLCCSIIPDIVTAQSARSTLLPFWQEVGVTQATLYASNVVYLDEAGAAQRGDAVLYLWVKAWQKDGITEVHGFGWLDDIHQPVERYGHWSQADLLATWQPVLNLYWGHQFSVPQAVTIFSNHSSIDRNRPFNFQLYANTTEPCFMIAPGHQANPNRPDMVAEFCVDESGLCDQLASSTPGETSVWITIPPFRSRLGAAYYLEFAAVLANHVQHHLAQGFRGYLLYATTYLLEALGKSPTLASLVQGGTIKLVRWDHTPWHSRFRSPAFDQPLVYSHALLSLGDCAKAALAFIDVDEYFHTPLPNMRLPQLMATCFVPPDRRGLNISTITLRRFNIRYSVVASSVSEYYLWIKPLDQYACHPLRVYDRLDERGFSDTLQKNIELPRLGVMGYFVHEGVLRPGHHRVYVPQECAVLLHVVHLFRPREVHEAGDINRFRPLHMWQFSNTTC